MKKKIDKILHQMDSYPMPDKAKMLATAPQVPAEENRARTAPVKHRFSPVKVTALAMAALLTVGGGVGVVAAEAKAYNEAIDFFEQYNLSAEGFTRSEVKKIYKDIVSESFTYEKTEEALASGLEGYVIQSQPLDSEGLKRVWMLGYVWGGSAQQDAREEGVEYFHHMHTGAGSSVPYAVIGKKKNGKDVWRKLLDAKVTLHEVCPVGDKVLAAGLDYASGNIRVYFLDSDASVIWKKDYSTEDFISAFTCIKVEYILHHNDNYVLFCVDNGVDADSGAGVNQMRILTIDEDGKLVSNRDVEYDSALYSITKAVPFGDSYLILKGTNQVLIEKDGKMTDAMSFGTETERYEFTDMAIMNGLVYLSGRSVTKVGNISHGWSGLFELYREKYGQQESVSAKEQTEFVKAHQSAILLICDPNSENMEVFYTIPGASGGTLEVSNNKLNWNVNRYTSANLYVNMNSHYSGGGSHAIVNADVWQYVFNPYGQLVGEKDTGMSVELKG